MHKKISALAATVFASTLVLAGCSSGGSGDTDTAETTAATAETAAETAAEQSSSALTLTDGYCRAKAADSDMTACFGTLKNSSDEDITVESFSAPELEGASTELHEVVDGMMRQKEGGFTVPAGSSQELMPGGEHLMIMNYPDPIEAGDTLKFTLSLSDGTEITSEFPIREQPSGEEDYGDLDHADHGEQGEEAEHSDHAAH